MNLAIESVLQDMSIEDKNLTSKNNYVGKNSVALPSVTEIIHRTIHKDALMYWANSLGLKGIRYGTFMYGASKAGTEAHAAIENYIKEKLQDSINIPFLGFMIWYNTLINNGNEVSFLQSELHMCGEWFGGTCDAVIRINGKNYLVDFKTSNRVSTSYFVQLGGYKYLIEKELGIIIDGGFIVLQLSKTEPGFDEYILRDDVPEHNVFINWCVNTMLALTYAYYCTIHADNLFDSCFGCSGGITS